MTQYYSSTIAFKCRKVDTGTIIDGVNGLNDERVGYFTKAEGVMLTISNDVVDKINTDLAMEQEFELIGRITYSIHHWAMYNVSVSINKARKVKQTEWKWVKLAIQLD